MFLDKDEILSMQPRGVLVKLIGGSLTQNKWVMPNGQSIDLSHVERDENIGRWVDVRCEVVRLGFKSAYYDWLQVGDIAYLSFNELRDAFGHMDETEKYLTDKQSGELYIMVSDKNKIPMVMRSPNLKPTEVLYTYKVTGGLPKRFMVAAPNMVIISQVEKPPMSTIIEVAFAEKFEDNIWLVEAVGEDRIDHGTPAIGSKVVLSNSGGIPIEDDFRKTTPKQLFWCRTEEVMAEV